MTPLHLSLLESLEITRFGIASLEVEDGFVAWSGSEPSEGAEWARPDSNWGLTPPKRQV